MLSLALLAQVAVSVIVQGAPTLAPFAQSDLGLTRGQVGLFNSALMAGSLSMMLVAGWVVEERAVRAGGAGRRRLLAWRRGRLEGGGKGGCCTCDARDTGGFDCDGWQGSWLQALAAQGSPVMQRCRCG